MRQTRGSKQLSSRYLKTIESLSDVRFRLREQALMRDTLEQGLSKVEMSFKCKDQSDTKSGRLYDARLKLTEMRSTAANE